MARSATEKKPAETKEVKLNPPRPFVGKRTDLNRFLQNIFVYLTINKDHYDTNEKKIGFVLSFLMEGDVAIWKEQFVNKVRKDAQGAATRGDDPSTKNLLKALRNPSHPLTHLETCSTP